MPDALVGLDVGTSGVKAVAVTHEGEVLATAEEGYDLSTPEPGFAEQDPEDWWQAAQACLARLPEGPIGLSGQMHGLVVLGADDQVLRPAILWNDQRTAAECAEIEARVGLGRLIELTGNRALTGFTAPKLLWLRTHEPETYARIRHVLLPKDYVRFRLTGERLIDAADASGTLLFDVAHRTGRPRCWTRWSSRPSGSRRPTSRRRSRAPATSGGCARRRDRLPGPVSVVLGTSGVVFAALPSYAADPEARVHVFCHAVPATWHAMGVMLSAAGSAAWVRQALGADFGILDAEAARWEPATEGLLFAPTSPANGRRTPIRTPVARSPGSRSATTAARSGVPRSKASPTGCATRSSSCACWASAPTSDASPAAGRAAASGCGSSRRPRSAAGAHGVRQASAFGAAMLSGVKAGVFSDAADAVARCVRVRDRIEPDDAWLNAYERGYARYRKLYPALRPLEDR